MMARGSRGSGRWAGYGGGYTLPVPPGGGAPDWVPANAVIHIDLIGGTPQGRAWVAGTGEVAVDTLLGSDPNTEAAWGPTSYDPSHLSAGGYSNGVLAFIGSARDSLLTGTTYRSVFQSGPTTASPEPLILVSADGNSAIEIYYREISPHSINASSWGGGLDETIDMISNTGVGSINVVAMTITPVRLDIAMNGSSPITASLTTDDFPTSGDSPLVAAIIDLSPLEDRFLQTITLYDPLPSTAGLSELSETGVTNTAPSLFSWEWFNATDTLPHANEPSVEVSDGSYPPGEAVIGITVNSIDAEGSPITYLVTEDDTPGSQLVVAMELSGVWQVKFRDDGDGLPAGLGEYHFTLRATDNGGLYVEQTFTLTIVP